MNKRQRDLVRACWSLGIHATFDRVDDYARKFKKYDAMRLSEIDEVVAKLKEIRKADSSKKD